MADGYAANSLTVHDVTVQDRTDFTPQGGLRKTRSVTFWVGVHGPFYLDYDVVGYSPEKVNSDIAQAVRELRSVVSADHAT